MKRMTDLIELIYAFFFNLLFLIKLTIMSSHSKFQDIYVLFLLVMAHYFNNLFSLNFIKYKDLQKI